MKPTCFMSKATSVPQTLFWGSVVVSQNPFKTQQATPTSVIQFISNYVYYQYFLQALTPAPSFTLKLLVIIHRSSRPERVRFAECFRIELNKGRLTSLTCYF